MQTARFTDAQAAHAAILAGNATVTLVSKATGARFTYRVRKAERGDAFFVSLLSGPNNDSDYAYMGLLSRDYYGKKGHWGESGYQLRTTAKSRVQLSAPSAKAINYALGALYERGEIPGTLEIWHEGRCCRCGRTLTVPESLATGLGPECARKASRAA